jgi:hypothetical protein
VGFEGVIAMGTQRSEQGRFLCRWDGGGRATAVGIRSEAASRRPAMQVAAHGALVDREPAGDFGPTEAALDGSDNPFA